MSTGKILIADDDRNVHESLGIYLKSEGFETVDVYDGAAAVSAHRRLQGDKEGISGAYNNAYRKRGRDRQDTWP